MGRDILPFSTTTFHKFLTNTNLSYKSSRREKSATRRIKVNDEMNGDSSEIIIDPSINIQNRLINICKKYVDSRLGTFG